MKQLHNIVAPLILFCLMAAVSLPVLAQEQENCKRNQKGETFDLLQLVFLSNPD